MWFTDATAEAEKVFGGVGLSIRRCKVHFITAQCTSNIPKIKTGNSSVLTLWVMADVGQLCLALWLPNRFLQGRACGCAQYSNREDLRFSASRPERLVLVTTTKVVPRCHSCGPVSIMRDEAAMPSWCCANAIMYYGVCSLF